MHLYSLKAFCLVRLLTCPRLSCYFACDEKFLSHFSFLGLPPFCCFFVGCSLSMVFLLFHYLSSFPASEGVKNSSPLATLAGLTTFLFLLWSPGGTIPPSDENMFLLPLTCLNVYCLGASSNGALHVANFHASFVTISRHASSDLNPRFYSPPSMFFLLFFLLGLNRRMA